MKKTLTLLCILCLSFITPIAFAQENETEIIFSENEWVHISIGGNTISSVVWEQYDEDIQLVFFAHNDTGLSFNQFVIEPNTYYSDIFDKFDVIWRSEITTEGKIKLYLSSDKGQITTIVEKFGGQSTSWGRPGTRYQTVVITNDGETKDIYSDEERICSFEWSFETVNNETVPQLTVHSPNGEIYSTGILTSTYTSVVEFFDQVGFMFEKMGDNYVKWNLYSNYDLEVRSSSGSGSKPLPFFRVSPADLEVYPGGIVTVEWTLPEGVTEYEVSWKDKQIIDYIHLIDERGPYQGQYETTFEFLDKAKDQKFTLKVSCEKYGTTYQVKKKIQVLTPIIDSLFWVIIGIVILIMVVLLFRHKIMERVHEPTSANKALNRSVY